MPAKGQVVSDGAKARFRETKHKKMLSKYNWQIIEPYLDVQLNISSRNRKNKLITLREFRSKVESGDSVRDIAKTSSKNLIVFYSNFSQGKISLTKEQFIDDYESGKSLEQISQENNISIDYIGYLRQLYEVKAKGPTFLHRKKTEIPLTGRQQEIVYGSMLGDAQKFSPSTVRFQQGEPQREYLEWKFEEFKSVASIVSRKDERSFDKRYNKWRIKCVFYTTANTDVEECIKKFYQLNPSVKEVSTDVLNCLTPLSVAVWYMDDGRTDFKNKVRQQTGWNIAPTFYFCTDMFSLQSCENIKEWFLDKWNIKARIKHRGNRKSGEPMHRIIIEHESNDDFVKLIRPHILPMFAYKIDYDAYLQWKGLD